MNHLVKRSGRLLVARVSRTRLVNHDTKFLMASSSTPSDTDFKPSEELAKERYDVRANEDIERKRARLMYQSRKRGMLENGVILASFANKFLHKLDAEHLDQYDQLINLPTNDWDIFYWATRTKPTPPEFETPVMHMLREHLHSKVSNQSDKLQSNEGILGKTRPEDIVMPASRKKFDLDVDYNKVSMTDYRQQLFDDRVKHIGNKEIANMMPWRKRYFVKRLRRKISSPVSLASMDDQRESSIYTTKVDKKSITDRDLLPQDPSDSTFEKTMKHHNLMQYFLSENLAPDALDYDDEAEAWANMLWHRNYGCHDDKIAQHSGMRCKQCLSQIHCCDPGLEGYIPRELFTPVVIDPEVPKDNILCQKCKFTNNYDARLEHNISAEAYEKFLLDIQRDRSYSVVIVLCDLTDFPGSIWRGLVDLIGTKKRIIVVGNKLDLLPYDGPKFLPRILYSMRKNLDRLRPGNRNLYVHDILAISARTGFGINSLVSRLLSACERPQNVGLIGNSNTGKSTLFNALLQSDLCAIRKGDIVSRVSKYKCPSTNINMLRFPIYNAEGWEIELKTRKTEIVERDFVTQEKRLEQLSLRRQESMPHMSMLINRLEYLPQTTSGTSDMTVITENALIEDKNVQPRFTEDHPLAKIEEGSPLTANEGLFPYNKFFYNTPSASHPDQIHNLLTLEERLEVFHNETIMPRKYSIRPLTTIFISGLARLDLLTSQSNVIITIFASKYLPIHCLPTRNADKFYQSFLGTAYLGVPRGDENRLAIWPDLINSREDFHICGQAQHIGAADIVFSSIGWATVHTIQDHECIVRAYTPEGRGIFLRNPPLLSRTNIGSMGRKIKDTPVFRQPQFKIDAMSAKTLQT